MSARAERRRAMKAERANPNAPVKFTAGGGSIRLANPVADHYATWIAGNATICQRVPQHLEGETCTDECAAVVEQNMAEGQHVVICGAGPSLAEHAAEWIPQADAVWGCNSALTFLAGRGYPVTHGFAVDQTADMLREWASTPDVEYLIATTVHPHLTQLLVSRGRRTRFFHNFVGLKERDVMYEGRRMGYEDWLYAGLFPTTIRAGSGLNAVTRAIDVARFMGYSRITVLGADCALRMTAPQPDAPFGSPEHLRWLRESVVMHADGGHALTSGATAVTMHGEIDGRVWLTKPDMAITAVCLAEMQQKCPEQIVLIGDTLPNALKDKPREFLRRLPSLVDRNNNIIPLTA